MGAAHASPHSSAHLLQAKGTAFLEKPSIQKNAFESFYQNRSRQVKEQQKELIDLTKLKLERAEKSRRNLG